MFHIRVYLLWFFLISTVAWRLIYFCRYVRTSFRLFYDIVNFILRSVRYQTICNEVILQSTSETRICFSKVIFSTLIIIVSLIEGWFIFTLILSLFLKVFFGWVSSSTVIEPWLSMVWSFCSSYWIFRIYVINLQGRYR